MYFPVSWPSVSFWGSFDNPTSRTIILTIGFRKRLYWYKKIEKDVLIEVFGAVGASGTWSFLWLVE